MPVFIFPQPGGSPLLSLVVGLAAIAIVVGLIIFFLPLIAGIFVAAIVLVAAVVLWGWVKRKFGLESEDERRFRETMEAAQRMAREQYHGGATGAGPTVYEREEVRVTTIGTKRRRMDDVEDIEENPPKPEESAEGPKAG